MVNIIYELSWHGFWLPTILFAFVTSASPGPVNIAALSSGITFGLLRTFPQVLGASIGFALLLIAMGFGMHVLIAKMPALYIILKVVGSLFLAYLAWKIWTASSNIAQLVECKPLSLLDGIISQWVNPKAWIVAASGIAAYTSPGVAYDASVVAISMVFFLICFPSVGAWAVFGVMARKLIQTEKTIQRLNIMMSVLLLVSIGTLFL